MLQEDHLKTLDRRLGVREAQLMQEIAAVRQRAEQREPGEVADAKDAAETEAQAVVADAEVERDLAELRDIRMARQRMAEGSYGTCVDCGSEIDLSRMLAQPQTSRCVECQELSERADNAKTAAGQPARHG
ncbi:MAG: TraR/DksA family transcriptional regulator [Burkholderiaceae bacterium]